MWEQAGKGGKAVKVMTEEELRAVMEERKAEERLVLSGIVLRKMDLSRWKLDNIDFSMGRFEHVCFDGADMKGSCIRNALFLECTFRGTDFRNADMQSAALRGNDLTGANIEGANLLCAVLEHAKLDGVKFNGETKYFQLYCPREGAFLGYKKCFNDRLVQLLIPADAKRTSATMSSCRCNKAKVLTIKSFDYQEEFEEAWSLADENFVYRKGEWVEVPDFDEDRWNDSTTGIHFWLTREEAKAY